MSRPFDNVDILRQLGQLAALKIRRSGVLEPPMPYEAIPTESVVAPYYNIVPCDKWNTLRTALNAEPPQ
jgi:hypothetical protein